MVRRLGLGIILMGIFFICLGNICWAQDTNETMGLPAQQEQGTVTATAITPESAMPAEPAMEAAPEAPAVTPEPAPAQNQTVEAPAAAVAATPEVAVEKTPEKTLEWVWGEVVAVAPQNKEIVIKHLDYETYEEVQMTLKVTDKTAFENASQLSDIRLKDHITVDYYVKDGANVAELIVVEKEDIGKTEEAAPAPVVSNVAQEEGASAQEMAANVTSIKIPDAVAGATSADVMGAPVGLQGLKSQNPGGALSLTLPQEAETPQGADSTQQ